jgi:hypothetical protein
LGQSVRRFPAFPFATRYGGKSTGWKMRSKDVRK